MSQKKYWQSFGELNNSEEFNKTVNDEFKEELPFEADNNGLLDAKAPRRDFLKYMGFSTAAAMAAASCETPVKKAIPYVNKPQDIIPGVSNYYATTYVSGGDAIPVVAKVRDGRPIKMEGNELSSYTKGGTTTHVQASVLDLYDTARLRFPWANGKEVSSLEAFDKMIADGMAGLGGSSVVLLTSTITSPSSKQVISEFLAKYPGSRHVQYDSVSYSGMLLANEATYGKKTIPAYHFEKAKVVVSLGADFLGTWLSPVEFQRGYSAGRKINEKNPEMSKHYQFESAMSLTGANADDRYTHRPSEVGAVAVALLNAVNGQASNAGSDKLNKGIAKAAKDLLAHKGEALVVSGSNDVNVQIVVNAINEAIGANGYTLSWATPTQTRQGVESDMTALIADIDAGKVGALLVYDVNPAYDYYDAEKFKAAIKKVKVSISFNEKLDETTELCKYILPSNHYLESWGDAEPKAGYVSMIQPTINPLFKTRQYQDSLLKWSGNTTGYHDYFKNFWTTKLGGNSEYVKALQDGVIEPAAMIMVISSAPFNGAKLAEATAAIGAAKKSTGVELVLYQKVTIGDGKQANNPWLQETPDPISKIAWDNYVMVSPTLGKQLFDVDITKPRQADPYEVNPEKQVVKVKVGSKEVELPAIIIPGMEANTIAIAVGYGRSEKIGIAANGVGKNVFGLARFNGTGADWNVGAATIEKTGGIYPLAQTQTHHSYEGRIEVVKETTLEEFKKNPSEILDERKKEANLYGGLENYEKDATIYPQYERPGVKWGMSIDMNACYGCGACVVACTAENNVSIVGKTEVLRAHEMHWLRIDRYFSGDPNDADNIQTLFQPMLCQHCDNAPCENVCPVAATNHSSEGLNQMTYNRCIGTRYCANNCPYKVRRFNWGDYTGADSFPDNQHPGSLGDKGHLDPAVFMMNDDLTRMVLNPDVTVRSRGVIEKCSFCVQRLQEGKLKAKKENRVLADSDIKTACQQACNGDAIIFGNANNKESAVSKARTENAGRLFYVLEQIHVLPNVSYLAKVRNTDHISEHKAGAAEHGAEHGTEHKAEAHS